VERDQIIGYVVYEWLASYDAYITINWKIIFVEGRGRGFKPQVASTNSMSFRFTKDDTWHGKYYIKCCT